MSIQTAKPNLERLCGRMRVLHVAIGKRCLLTYLEGGRDEALRRAPEIWNKLHEALKKEPFPEQDAQEWWEAFASKVLSKTVKTVKSPKSWRPPKSA